MPLKNDENTAETPSKSIFIHAIAGRIDARGRTLAQKLHKKRNVYYGYAALDSLSSSYSMVKFAGDVFITNNDIDSMHELMLSPGGIAGIVAESVFLISFSLLACHFESDKQDYIKKFIASSWPYFRDVIKGLKNAHKGWRSTVQAVNVITGSNLNVLIIPVGLTLGVLAAANRLWLRRMVEARKIMMADNAELLRQIKELSSLNEEEHAAFLHQIRYQSADSRLGAYIGVSIGGLVDGLYLYVGVLSLAALTYPIFTAMSIVCLIYTVSCIIARLYEEFDFQQRLVITQSKCKLALITKEMETSYQNLLLLMMKQAQGLIELGPTQLDALEYDLCVLIDNFEETRLALKNQTLRTYFTALLLGLKNGLYAYGALASVLFLVGSIMVMTSCVFPPALLIASVGTGVVFMVGFIVHSLRMHSQHLKKQTQVNERPYSLILEMRSKFAQRHHHGELLESEHFRASLKDGLLLDPSPQFFFQEWFEVIRSFFSGIAKGQKFIDFAGNPLQELGMDGHYHDTPLMYVMAFFSALFFAIVLALRALARGLGRPPLGQSKLDDIELKEFKYVDDESEDDGYHSDTSSSLEDDASSECESESGSESKSDITPDNNHYFPVETIVEEPDYANDTSESLTETLLSPLDSDPVLGAWRTSSPSPESISRPVSSNSFFSPTSSRRASPVPVMRHSSSMPSFVGLEHVTEHRVQGLS